MTFQGKTIIIGKVRKKGEYEGNKYAFTEFTCIEPNVSENSSGHKSFLARGDYDVFDSVQVPAVYDVDVEFQGNKTLYSRFEYVSDFELIQG